MNIRPLMAAVLLLTSGATFAGGTLGSFASTDPLDNGYHGTRLWTDQDKTGFNVTFGVNTDNAKFGDKTYGGGGIDYKWKNGIYAGARVIASEHTDTESGYVGYNGHIIDKSILYWVQAGSARLNQDYDTDHVGTTLNEAQVGIEKRHGDYRLGAFTSFAKLSDFDAKKSKFGLYGEAPVFVATLSGNINRVNDKADGYSLHYNQYQLAIGRVFSNNFGLQVAVDRNDLPGAKSVVTGKLSYQF